MQRNDMKTGIRDAETTYSKAVKAELAKEYDQAFRLYIKAAELFLHLSRASGQIEKDRTKWKANAQKSLERAEKIKSFTEKLGKSSSASSGGSVASPHLDIALTPIGINHFSAQEQSYVLRRGSTVNGLTFPLWDDPEEPKSSSDTPFVDPTGQPDLSPEQRAVSPVWRRPNYPWFHPPYDPSLPKILPQDILQHIVTDCSVCASISVCLEHGRRFGSHIAESPIHHYYDSKALGSNGMTPKVFNSQKSGRFDFRILFNGAWRRIVIDDQLPCDPINGTLMCMSILPSTKSPHTIWPSLLEKAYMKLMGGYDFPGSNSSIDLHAIAGWIPEHIEIHRSDFERERSWERISKGFLTGQCMVTLGTGTRHDALCGEIKLLPSHSYAVIGAFEADEGRMLTVLDSWVRSSGETKEPSRILHVPWSEVLSVFSGIYLSWDPAIWQRSLNFHGMWKRTAEPEEGSRQLRLKFNRKNSKDEEFWVLLTRHCTDTRRVQDFIALRVEVDDDAGRNTAFNQQTLCTKGTYTNSTHILVRTRIPEVHASGVISILASYDGDAKEVGFTLSAYASEDVEIQWDEDVRPPPYTNKIDGSFTTKNAGGSCTHPTFMVNPQYRLLIQPRKVCKKGEQKAETSITLRTGKDMPINLAVVWSQGQRITDLSTNDLVASSGAYTYGLAKVTKDLFPGEYTVIASAFDPHYLGSFTLKADCSFPFSFIPIPQEGAGMYNKTVRGSWEKDSAAGGPSFDRYSKNPMFELDIPAVTQLKIRLQIIHPPTPTSLNVTVYPAIQNQGRSNVSGIWDHDFALLRHAATSGGYDDSIAGVATPQITMGPGKYWIIPSTYNPGVEATFRLIAYFSVAGVKLTEIGRV